MRTDDYERGLLEAYEGGGMSPKDPSEALSLRLVQASENTFKKDKRINIRLSSHDLEGIQRKAVRKGIPYQALISGLIHQYVEGDLIEK